MNVSSKPWNDLYLAKEVTSYQKHAEQQHEEWVKREQARKDLRAAYDYLHETDYKMLVNLIFEFANDLGYELTPRNPTNEK